MGSLSMITLLFAVLLNHQQYGNHLAMAEPKAYLPMKLIFRSDTSWAKLLKHAYISKKTTTQKSLDRPQNGTNRSRNRMYFGQLNIAMVNFQGSPVGEYRSHRL